MVQPNRKTNPASDRDGSYNSDTDDSPCSSAADSAIVQHKTYEDGADDLENIEHERIEGAGADVEIQCYASLNWRCPVDKLQEVNNSQFRLESTMTATSLAIIGINMTRSRESWRRRRWFLSSCHMP